MTYTIKHKTGWIAASGFYSKERAYEWLKRFDAKMYVDKTLKVEDFIIVEGK